MKDLSAKQEARSEKKKRKVAVLAEIMKLNDEDRKMKATNLNDEPLLKRVKIDEEKQRASAVIIPESSPISAKGQDENKQIVRERTRNNRTNPKFRLTRQGDSALLVVDANVRTPIYLSDVQLLIMASLPGSFSPYPPVRWCSLEKSNNIMHTVVLVIEGLSLYYYQSYESQFEQTSHIFSKKFEVVMPTDGNGLLAALALTCLPVTSEQRQKLRETFGIVEAAKDDVHSLVHSVFPTSSESTNGTSTDECEDVFPRTKLLLSALQLVDEAYPIPLQGELAIRFKDFVMTKNQYAPVTSTSPMFALDCEMCFTDAGCNEVTRISIVNEKYESVYETLVLPKNKIVDYLTPYSGITAQMMENVTKSLDEVQRDVQNLLPPDAILVGQSLNCDLMAIKMMHPYVIDTSVIFNLSGVPRMKSKLQTLAREFLGESIQSNTLGHDSIEDCATSLKLVKLKLTQGIFFGDAYLSGRAQASIKTEKPCTRSTLLITSSDDAKLKHVENEATSDFQFMQVDGNKIAIKKTCELAIQHNLTMTHLNIDPERLNESTVDKMMRSVDRSISKVYEKLAIHGMMIVLIGGASDTNSGVAMVKIKKHQTTLTIN